MAKYKHGWIGNRAVVCYSFFDKTFKFAGMKTPTMRSMYEETNRVAEKWAKIAFCAIAILTPIGFCCPKAIFIYLIYYTMDSENDAFVLPFSMWLVKFILIIAEPQKSV